MNPSADQPLALAQTLLAGWAQAFAANDPAAMLPLYRDDGAMYGSKPELFVGRDGVDRYFSSLQPRQRRAVRFEAITAVQPMVDLLAVAAIAFFEVDSLTPIPMRFTQTWMRGSEGWQVLSHHASPRQAPAAAPTKS